MIKINSFEAENVKRIKAVKIEPTPAGLTVIGGKNRQGKTSILDAITWALGGNRYRPSEAKRRDSVIPPTIKIELSNGLIVERKGKNASLQVTDPQGGIHGQALLDSFVEELALNLPKFMEMSSKDKAQTLLQIIGVEDELSKLELEEQGLYNKRRAIGQIKEQKEKAAKEMDHFAEAPEGFIALNELVKKQQAILDQNRENEKKRDKLINLKADNVKLAAEIKELEEKLAMLKIDKAELDKAHQKLAEEVKNLEDESTEEIEKEIENAEEINQMVRANQDKFRAQAEAEKYKEEYDDLTKQIENARKAQLALLENAALPLEGLSIQDGELTYKGDQWDNMAGSDQLKVATAIVRKLKPECGFVLLDKLEQMDLDTLQEFGKWLEKEGLQAIATRVSTGDECSIIIEDGYALEDKTEPQELKQEPKWKKGEF